MTTGEIFDWSKAINQSNSSALARANQIVRPRSVRANEKALNKFRRRAADGLYSIMHMYYSMCIFRGVVDFVSCVYGCMDVWMYGCICIWLAVVV